MPPVEIQSLPWKFSLMGTEKRNSKYLKVLIVMFCFQQRFRCLSCLSTCQGLQGINVGGPSTTLEAELRIGGAEGPAYYTSSFLVIPIPRYDIYSENTDDFNLKTTHSKKN